MTRSDSLAHIAPAIKLAFGGIGAAEKGGKNPHFKSTFATLGDVMEACKAPLLAQGISVLQMVGNDETGSYLETILLHESGEFISDRMKLAVSKQNDPQALGSAISYARRYALQAACFIPAADDDGEAAMERHDHEREESARRVATPRSQAKPVPKQQERAPVADDPEIPW